MFAFQYFYMMHDTVIVIVSLLSEGRNLGIVYLFSKTKSKFCLMLCDYLGLNLGSLEFEIFIDFQKFSFLILSSYLNRPFGLRIFF